MAIMDILFATDFMDEHPEMLDAAIEKRLKGTPMIATLGPLQSALIFDPLEALRSFEAPALILHGEDDELVLPVHAEILAGAIPNGTVQITPNGGHALVVEQSEAVVAAISGVSFRGCSALGSSLPPLCGGRCPAGTEGGPNPLHQALRHCRAPARQSRCAGDDGAGNGEIPAASAGMTERQST